MTRKKDDRENKILHATVTDDEFIEIKKLIQDCRIEDQNVLTAGDSLAKILLYCRKFNISDKIRKWKK